MILPTAYEGRALFYAIHSDFSKGKVDQELAKLITKLNYQEKIKAIASGEVARLENRLTEANVQRLEQYYWKSELMMYRQGPHLLD